MICDFSNLSASCPAVAENRKNGSINKPGSKVASVPPSIVVRLAVWKATKVINAVLKTLSLNAPKNCVKKNGRKRCSLIKVNWLLIVIIFLSIKQSNAGHYSLVSALSSEYAMPPNSNTPKNSPPHNNQR